MSLKFTPQAVDDLRRLKNFIANKNEQAAKRTIQSLKTKIQALEQHPHLGRPVKEFASCRDLIIQRYIIRYQVKGNSIWILRLWHHKEHRP